MQDTKIAKLSAKTEETYGILIQEKDILRLLTVQKQSPERSKGYK